ncbi:MAG: hypothetical protein DMD63_01880 [Gemmatimonadetes bacterium]|nr:MAG: hypothetical protein DMD63_01880 [Gemmatimonadota bacterium]
MRVLVIATLAFLLGCSDVIGPNTDVGLSVWADVSPTFLSIRDTITPIRIRVYVSNTTGHEIRVVSGGPPYVFTSDPARNSGTWGSFRITKNDSLINWGPGIDWWGDSVYVFRAHYTEYNEEVVTLAKWKGWNLAPGLYRVRSWFNTREGRSAPFYLIR